MGSFQNHPIDYEKQSSGFLGPVYMPMARLAVSRGEIGTVRPNIASCNR
jgi:hypothetical protein